MIVDRIRGCFEERFTDFIDIGPGFNIKTTVAPLKTTYFKCDPDNPFSECEKHSANPHADYINGTTLSYAISLVADQVEFTEESVARAEALKSLHIASPLFQDVKSHLLTGAPGFDAIKAKSEAFHERFIREMAIEFNQVPDADGYVESFNMGEITLDEIVECLKSEYYSTWKNEKDYVWIASLSDYTDAYIIKEYAKLDAIV